jgi:cellulose synthase operon protein C
LMQDNENGAQKAMRDAQLVLNSDALPLFLAHAYEALHRWFDAETTYREIYDIKPDDVRRAKMLAEFYLGPLYPRNDKKEKATPLLNQILHAGADGKIPSNDPDLLWARRLAAVLLAATNDYQDLKKAENLLASNSQDGSLLIDDKRVMADLLSRRPEPINKKKALALYEEIDQSQKLNEAESIKLGDLYFATRADWSQYQSQMEKTIARFPNSAAAREAYVQQLLIHGDANALDRAAQLVDELRKLAPNNPKTFELTVQIATKRGMQAPVAAELRRRLPDFSQVKDLDEGKKQSALTFANLLVELNDLDSAEKIYRDLAARDPKLVLAYAKFLGQHRSPDECFAKLNEQYSVEKIPELLTIGLAVARDRRDKIGDKFDGLLQKWLDAGQRENPDAISLRMMQADLYDLQKRYDDAANVDRKLLADKNLTGTPRAIVLNNLAYLLALAGKTTATDDDPMKLVAEATQILGPNSDILDTRAVVFMSQGKYKEAIDDLELSVTDSPTASKYFHLAVAHLRAGDTRAAVDAWQQAEGMGLGRDSLNRMEHDLYEKVKVEIDKIRGTSRKAERSENLRKAG